ncbi:putative bifunctional diguanylate cyclase/phosphodiesterase [Planosporangium sp. 12N6]|uniref:putative bifunctional diguanylate cyclase/phosphodiesterase n=1 Tax=Planosporangium spinosum TaxID=3402278 RepID=UPI003CF8C63C
MPGPRSTAPRSEQLAWYVTATCLLVSLAVAVPLGIAEPEPLAGWPVAAIFFFGLFWAAEAVRLNFDFRRQTLAVFPAEIPLVLALAYLPPLTVVLLRFAGALLAQLYWRTPTVKFYFNLAVRLAGMSVAGFVVFATVGSPAGHPLPADRPVVWLALVAAACANYLVSLAAVAGVIALVQGRTSPRDMARAATPGLFVAAINVTVGLSVLLMIQKSIWSLLLLAGLGLVLVKAYRAYATFVRQHRSMRELYELMKAVEETGRDGTVIDVLLARVRELMRADCATLWLNASGRHPELLLSARVDYQGLLDSEGSPEKLRRRALETGRTVAVGPKLDDGELLAELRAWGGKDAIVVPLRSGEAVIGTLEVTGRLSDLAHFNDDDVRLLETVAAHAAAAVENSRLVERLRFDAYHDALTGLPNRRRILSALDEAIKVQTPDDVVAALVFDVARLRHLNNSLGHTAGDKLLVEVARRLRDLAPPAALVGRIGGNEFALTVRVANAEAAVALAVDIRESLQTPLSFGVLTTDVDCAVGVAVHPDHADDSATLLQRADVATHAAKVRHTSVQLFTESLESRSVRRVGLAGDLRRALDAGELQVYFQPKVGLRDRRLVGVECLARWEHPAHGAVAPEDFVAAAEHTGQLGRLTEVVLREGLRRAREWRDSGRELPVSVNLSPRTLLDPAFPGRVAELLDGYGVDPAQLTLEISAGGVVGGPDRPVPTLHALRALGVRLSVDDFGTEYSSLGHLRRLPVQEVKIDRTFVQGMATDPDDLAIVRAVVDLSRRFGLSVVAEGVESELTLGLLEEIGCDVGQGFLFSRPLPYERLDAWYAAQTQAGAGITGEVRWLRAVP